MSKPADLANRSKQIEKNRRYFDEIHWPKSAQRVKYCTTHEGWNTPPVTAFFFLGTGLGHLFFLYEHWLAQHFYFYTGSRWPVAKYGYDEAWDETAELPIIDEVEGAIKRCEAEDGQLGKRDVEESEIEESEVGEGQVESSEVGESGTEESGTEESGTEESDHFEDCN